MVASRRDQDIPSLSVEALRALGRAWGNLGAYPAGHPVLRGALDQAHRALGDWLASGGNLVLGVRRDRFLHGIIALDSPPAQRLAGALYDRGVAVVQIDAGVAVEEIEVWLRALVGGAGRAARSPIWEELVIGGVRHIRLQPVDYSLIRVTEDLSPRAEPADRAEAESLTDRLVRILMARVPRAADPSFWDQLLLAREQSAATESPAGGAPEEMTALLARLIGRYVAEGEGAGLIGVAAARDVERSVTAAGTTAAAEPAVGLGPPSPRGDVPGRGVSQEAQAADRSVPASSVLAVVIGVLESQLSRPGTPARVQAARQAAQLTLGLPPAIADIVIRSVLRALGAQDDPAPLYAYSSPLPPDSVGRAFRVLAAEKVAFSRHALLLIQTLAALKSAQVEPLDDEADGEMPETVRNELVALFRDEDVDRYNPEDHQALLARMAVEIPAAPRASATSFAALGDRADSLADDVLAEHLRDALLQLLARPPSPSGALALGLRLETLFGFFLARGRLEQAASLVEAMRSLANPADGRPADIRELLGTIVERFSTVETLAALAALAPSEHSGDAKRLVEVLGPAAVDSLLLVLIGEQNLSYRRHIFDVLASLGPAIAPGARRHLGDPRWYVVRNMVGLLRSVADRTSVPDVYLLVGHGDPRVRVEALRGLLALRVPEAVEGLVRLIDDPNPAAATAAATLAGEYRSPMVREALLRVLDGWDLMRQRRTIRLNALRALGQLGDPAALPRLSRFFASWVARFFAREERRTAYRSLRGYPPDARRAILERGLASDDAEIRQVCARLAAGEHQGAA